MWSCFGDGEISLKVNYHMKQEKVSLDYVGMWPWIWSNRLSIHCKKKRENDECYNSLCKNESLLMYEYDIQCY